MQSDEGRRAGRVDDQRRPVQTQRVSRTSCRDTWCTTSCGVAVCRLRLDVSQAGIVRSAAAEIDACARILEAIGGDARVFEGFPGYFEDQTLLRIHRYRFAWTDAKKSRVELVDIRQKAAMREGSVSGNPAIGGHRCYGIATLFQLLPHLGGRVAERKATRHADDGDRR